MYLGDEYAKIAMDSRLWATNETGTSKKATSCKVRKVAAKNEYVSIAGHSSDIFYPLVLLCCDKTNTISDAFNVFVKNIPITLDSLAVREYKKKKAGKYNSVNFQTGIFLIGFENSKCVAYLISIRMTGGKNLPTYKVKTEKLPKTFSYIGHHTEIEKRIMDGIKSGAYQKRPNLDSVLNSLIMLEVKKIQMMLASR